MELAGDLASKDPATQLEAIDREVDRYSKWLAELKDSRASGPLSNAEKALVKTYLVQKLHGKIDEVG